jgi:hypothetical protein
VQIPFALLAAQAPRRSDRYLGAKGVVELSWFRASRWGRGPKKDLHSSQSPWTARRHLVEALVTLVPQMATTP